MALKNGLPIDTHSHIVTPSLVEEARKGGQNLGVTVEDTDRGPALQFEGLTHLRPLGGLARLDLRLEWMDKQGLGLQILASWLDIQGYTLPAENAATWARLFIEHLSQVVESQKTGFEDWLLCRYKMAQWRPRSWNTQSPSWVSSAPCWRQSRMR